jgi:hypothetical protein
MAGGSLHDTWDARGDLPVPRRTCAEQPCTTRPQYRDDTTGEPLCGPHFRQRRKGAPPSPAAVPAPSARAATPPASPSETTMPAAHPPLIINPDAPAGRCRIVGCDAPVQYRGLCSKGYQLAHRTGKLDEVGLAATTPAKAGGIRVKAAAPKAPAPNVQADPDLEERRAFAKLLGMELGKVPPPPMPALREACAAVFREEARLRVALSEMTARAEAAEGHAREASGRADTLAAQLDAANDVKVAVATLARSLTNPEGPLPAWLREQVNVGATATGEALRLLVKLAEECDRLAAHAHGAQATIEAEREGALTLRAEYGARDDETMARWIGRLHADSIALAALRRTLDCANGNPTPAEAQAADANVTPEDRARLLAFGHGWRDARTAAPSHDAIVTVAAALRRDLFRALGGEEQEEAPSWEELLRRVQALDSEAPEVLAARAARGLEMRALALTRKATALREIAGGEVHGA